MGICLAALLTKRWFYGRNLSFSEIEAGFKDECWLGPARIKDVGREIEFLARYADEESALNIQARVISLGSLRDQAHANPFHGRICEFGPAVEKTSVVIFCIENVFARARKRDSLVRKREFVTGSYPSGVSKNSSDHWRDIQLQLVPETEVVTQPRRTGLLIFVVVTCLKMKPRPICCENG